MDTNPLDSVAAANTGDRPAAQARRSWLNPAVAITVALLATFMGRGLRNLKDQHGQA